MPERDPTRRIAPHGLLKRWRHEAVEAKSPSPQEPSTDDRALRLPVSPLLAALLPLPRGIDLTPEGLRRPRQLHAGLDAARRLSQAPPRTSRNGVFSAVRRRGTPNEFVDGHAMRQCRYRTVGKAHASTF
ncbi:hypothetical protein RKD37_002640 [Streptomyces ambofaciens]